MVELLFTSQPDQPNPYISTRRKKDLSVRFIEGLLFDLIHIVGIFFLPQESYHVTVHATPSLARVPVTKNAPVSRVWLASVHAHRDSTSIIVEASFRPASKKRQHSLYCACQ